MADTPEFIIRGTGVCTPPADDPTTEPDTDNEENE